MFEALEEGQCQNGAHAFGVPFTHLGVFGDTEMTRLTPCSRPALAINWPMILISRSKALRVCSFDLRCYEIFA